MLLCRSEDTESSVTPPGKEPKVKKRKRKGKKLDRGLLLEGELTTVVCGECTLRRSEAEDASGLLYITNYRLLFVASKGEVVEGCNGCAQEAMFGEEFKKVYSVPLLELREVQSTETQGDLEGRPQVGTTVLSPQILLHAQAVLILVMFLVRWIRQSVC